MTSSAWLFLGCIWTTIFTTIAISMRKINKIIQGVYYEGCVKFEISKYF